MSLHRRCFAACRTIALAFVLALVPVVAAAQQTGRVAGTLRGTDGQPLAGAEVLVVGTQLSALTGADGAFMIDNVAVGRRQLRVTHLSYREAMISDVLVQSGTTAQVDLSMQAALFRLNDVVVSASRQAQRITDAPATITRIDASVIENTVGNSFSGALKQVKGLDFIQVGVTSAAVNARGFNSSFNNRMLMMEDGRIAVLPENGLPVGSFTAIPKLDLASVEVLIGPGAALYGADASNGVITLETKDPRAYKGTTLEFAGGTRSYMDIQGRHAGLVGNFGYKIAAEHQQAEDFSNVVKYRTNTLTETGVGDKVNWDSKVSRGTGALYYYTENSRFELSTGLSVTDGVGQTNVGRNQLDNWQYNFVQAKWSNPNWYVNAYRTQSKAGDSYALNRFTENKADNPGKTDEELRLMSDWPSNGQLYAAEIQNNFTLPAVLNTRVVWGAQFRHDIVSSDREWLTDRLTGEDLTVDQKGAYAQVEAELTPKLQLIAAARVDDHDNYDTQFSPKGGVVFKPAENQALRLIYNRAFKSPTTLQTNFFIPDFVRFVGVFGNKDGFTVKNAAGVAVRSYSPLVPEENQTFEVGYKGVIGTRVFVDVAAYRSEYKDFLSPLTTIANPYSATAPERAYDHNDQLVSGPSGPQIVLTYFNLGEATVNGSDIGVRVLAAPKVELSSTFSWTNLDKVEVPAGSGAVGLEATALNAPEVKWTLGATARELVPNVTAGFVVRHVTGYQFRSGINVGKIPTFDTIDLDASIRLPVQGARLNVNLSNLFTCRTTYKDAERDGRSCGFNEEHQEMINMPGIKSLIFLGIRYAH